MIDKPLLASVGFRVSPLGFVLRLYGGHTGIITNVLHDLEASGPLTEPYMSEEDSSKSHKGGRQPLNLVQEVVNTSLPPPAVLPDVNDTLHRNQSEILRGDVHSAIIEV